jgi:hypothetical protein
MPHLEANALASDPEGVALLRDVIGERSGRAGPWNVSSKAAAVLRPLVSRPGNQGRYPRRLPASRFPACDRDPRQMALCAPVKAGAARSHM